MRPPKKLHPQQLPWRQRMTLCIAATCQDKGKPCIVVSSDWKAEIGDVASAEIQNKLYWMCGGRVCVLVAGTASSAHSLRATLKQHFKFAGLTEANVGDRLKAAVLKHKDKLTHDYVHARHSKTYEYFLTHRAEFPEQQWNETHANIRRLPLQCAAIICLFLKRDPFMFMIEDDADVWREENFLTIGTGSTIANSILCFRRQNDDDNLDDAIYNVFEATMFARKSKTPGVGRVHAFSVLYPNRKQMRLRNRGKKFMGELFNLYGPHNTPALRVPKECWEPY
jgi:ATP-dependent protease HslVU (ClpYQ) peptidase subunit